MPSAVYDIKDVNVLNFLVSAGSVGADAIRDLSRNNKLIEAEGNEVLKAVTKSNNGWYRSYWVIFSAVCYLFSVPKCKGPSIPHRRWLPINEQPAFQKIQDRGHPQGHFPLGKDQLQK
ncbi:MAG: hypothetical protein E2600_05850 [Chryseobacterium sp.]|nr:hypothetical protein [Chryseobacterium sp.]